MYPKHSNNSGFTLLELSIVLVIIGLIVGGVLVGRDLIAAAEIRATIGQYEKYKTAMRTFQTKYNAMPGDMYGPNAAAFGLFSTGMTGVAGLGDGNGQLQSYPGLIEDQAGETLVFWTHLSQAGLLDSAITIPNSGGQAPVGSSTGFFPRAKTNGVNHWIAYNDRRGNNWLEITRVTAVTATMGDTDTRDGLTPMQAYNIDIKLDDGMPNRGTVNAQGGSEPRDSPSWSATQNATVCIIGASAADTAAVYAVGTLSSNGINCSLQLRLN